VITVPGKNSTSKDVVIKSATKANVISAATQVGGSSSQKQFSKVECSQIEMTVSAARDKAPFTHFLSIPLTDDTILASLRRLQVRFSAAIICVS
jgi:hypothetical protein